MRHNVRFAWLMSREDACKAASYLSDKESYHYISFLASADNEEGKNEIECEAISTRDVERVTITHHAAQLWQVAADVTFEVDDVPIYSPYNFDGEFDFPPLQTWQPDESYLKRFRQSNGEPYVWGETSPIPVERELYKKMINHTCMHDEEHCQLCSEPFNNADRRDSGVCGRCSS